MVRRHKDIFGHRIGLCGHALNADLSCPVPSCPRSLRSLAQARNKLTLELRDSRRAGLEPPFGFVLGLPSAPVDAVDDVMGEGGRMMLRAGPLAPLDVMLPPAPAVHGTEYRAMAMFHPLADGGVNVNSATRFGLIERVATGCYKLWCSDVDPVRSRASVTLPNDTCSWALVSMERGVLHVSVSRDDKLVDPALVVVRMVTMVDTESKATGGNCALPQGAGAVSYSARDQMVDGVELKLGGYVMKDVPIYKPDDDELDDDEGDDDASGSSTDDGCNPTYDELLHSPVGRWPSDLYRKEAKGQPVFSTTSMPTARQWYWTVDLQRIGNLIIKQWYKAHSVPASSELTVIVDGLLGPRTVRMWRAAAAMHGLRSRLSASPLRGTENLEVTAAETATVADLLRRIHALHDRPYEPFDRMGIVVPVGQRPATYFVLPQ